MTFWILAKAIAWLFGGGLVLLVSVDLWTYWWSKRR